MSINGPTVHHAFSESYYRKLVQFKTEWFGTTIIKCPFDLWLYQEIIWATRPEVVVETGTFAGGSALYLAHLFDILGEGQVVSVDIEVRDDLPGHPRIEYLAGASSTDSASVSAVRKRCEGKRTMVILDSEHASAHVYDELDKYAPFVTKGCYLIVEDTNFHAYPGMPRSTGPAQALRDWQPTNKGFEVDRAIEKFGFSQNPGGYLKRVRP